MLTLIRLELLKLFSRGIAYIGFAAIFLIVIIVQVGMFVEGEKLLNFLIQNLSGLFELQGNLINIYTVSYIILNSLWIHIPILVTIVAGDMISGEAQRGTFRLLLTRPVSRTQLLTAKFITAQLYTSMLVIWLLILSLGMGRFFFDTGDMIVLLSSINIIDQSDVLWRFLLAFAYGMLSQWVVGALAFLFSVRASNSLTPVIGAMSVIILFSIISNFSVGVFEPIKPYLFTSYLTDWQLFFDMPLQFDRIYKASGVLLAHLVVFFALSFFHFKYKDINS